MLMLIKSREKSKSVITLWTFCPWMWGQMTEPYNAIVFVFIFTQPTSNTNS